MIRLRNGMLAVLLTAGAGASLFAASRSMPDLATQYAQRRNCYIAYDLLVEQSRAGTISAAERAWGQSFEEAATAGKACPEPPQALAERASNRTVSTEAGLVRLAVYVKQKNPAALYDAAMAVLTGKAPNVDPKEGWGLLKLASDLGEPDAQYRLGLFFAGGTIGGKADYAAALPLIEAAAKANHPDALFQAGNFYKAGLGARTDKKKAFAYYQAAAERGHIYGAIMAYYMIQDGEGTAKDFNLAYRLARNLADRGEVYGAVMSAGALLQQKNAKDHEEEVLYWMDVAIRDGDQRIQSEVGKLRPRVVAAFSRAKAPPEYQPRRRKLCPLKRVCYVNSFSGLQSCTTNVDYWNDCDTGLAP
jgi:TPR repeat protein